MAETPRSTDNTWSPVVDYGRLALLFLTVLLMHVTRPLADALVVMSVYGYEGYADGIRVVGLLRCSYFSTGADLPGRSGLWAFFGSFAAAVAIVSIAVSVIRRGLARLPGSFAARLKERLDQLIGFRPQPPRPDPMTPRETVLLIACFFGGGLLVMFGPHLWRSVDLALHEQRTQGVVVRAVTPGTIIYRYSVAGREYPGTYNSRSRHSWTAGSPVEVRYSGTHPAISTPGDPLALAKQVLCATVIIACFLTLIWFDSRRRQRKATAGP